MPRAAGTCHASPSHPARARGRDQAIFPSKNSVPRHHRLLEVRGQALEPPLAQHGKELVPPGSRIGRLRHGRPDDRRRPASPGPGPGGLPGPAHVPAGGDAEPLAHRDRDPPEVARYSPAARAARTHADHRHAAIPAARHGPVCALRPEVAGRGDPQARDLLSVPRTDAHSRIVRARRSSADGQPARVRPAGAAERLDRSPVRSPQRRPDGCGAGRFLRPAGPSRASRMLPTSGSPTPRSACGGSRTRSPRESSRVDWSTRSTRRRLNGSPHRPSWKAPLRRPRSRMPRSTPWSTHWVTSAQR